jgi:membrane-associated HD superfamily phosphohydrolase
MEKQLQELLESEVLGAEAREALQEAFSAKLKEAETKLQESYAARFDHERAQLVETMDLMLTDVIRKELSEFAEDKRSVAAQKVRLATALKEADARSQKHVNAQLKLLEAAMTDQIRKEVTEFRTERKAVLAERDALASDMARHKQLVESQVAAKVAKLEQFVLRQLSEEVQEFATDKQALVEQRVKLQRESRTKLQETQQQFMHRATQAVDRTLNRVIREELVQWRADIKQARENNFGRKIFEAVAAEYMSSYLSEGSAVKKMQSEMVQLQAQLQEAHRKISHNQTLLESERRMTQQVREQATRNKVLHELLNPLRGERRAIMENLLQDIRTTNLKEAYERYLPTVMNGDQPRKAAAVQPRTVAHSGDRVNLVETQTAKHTTEESQDLQNILYLAGIAARAQ